MIFYLTDSFQKKVKKLCKKDPPLRLELSKQFETFQRNPYHPSPRLHKLKGKRSTQYAIWIKGNLRALSIKNGDTYIFFDLVTHNQY